MVLVWPPRPVDKFVTVNGLKLHYLEWGDSSNQTMIVVHGQRDNGHTYDFFSAAFSTEYHILALDRRGFGDSEWSKEGHYTRLDDISDLTALIDKLDLDILILMGHSRGASVCWTYTAEHPGKVSRLIIIDQADGGERTAARNRSAGSRSWVGAAGRIRLELAPKEFDSIEDMLHLTVYRGHMSYEMMKHWLHHNTRWLPNGKITWKYDPDFIKGTGTEGRKDLPEIKSHGEYLKKIECPTLLLRGTYSYVIPSAKQVERMKMIMKDLVVVEIPGATHKIAMDNPEAFEKAVKNFLSN